MILRILVVFTGLAAAISGCWAACTVDDLAQRVKVLEPTGAAKATTDFFDESGVYHRPTPSSDSPAAYLPNLKDAFRLAGGESGGFREALCKLDYIFIDTSDDAAAPIGWGFWEGPDQGPDSGKIQAVGLSTRLWSDSTFDTLTGTETLMVQSSLRSSDSDRRVTPLSGFGYTAANQNTRRWVLLSVLAHELGHVSYRDGDMIPDSCYVGWRVVQRKRDRFKRFRDVAEGNEFTRFEVIRNKVGAGDDDGARKIIHRVYESGRFGSLLALESPEEDFPETLKLAVLSKAGLSRLVAEVQGEGRTNVMQPFNTEQGGLFRKARCFWPFLVPPDLP